MSKDKKRPPPLDLMQDDHTHEAIDPTLLGDRISDEFDRDDIGEDRDGSPPRRSTRSGRPHPSD